MDENAGSSTPLQETPEKTSELLPLDARERVAVVNRGGRVLRHTFRRITSDDWERFFRGVVAEVRQAKGGDLERTVDADGAALDLYQRASTKAEGYDLDGIARLEDAANWRDSIPQRHCLIAVNLLMTVHQSSVEDEFRINPAFASVSLDALWSENEADRGRMKKYFGLVHRFAHPSGEQKRRFARAKNRAYVRGGSRSGVTIVPSSHPVLVKLYDELVEQVEGYSICGRELQGKSEIVSGMDALHKGTAVARLFETPSDVDYMAGDESSAVEERSGEN